MATKNKAEQSPDDLIAAAMAQATVASGANQLPAAHEVPEAFTTGHPALSPVSNPSDSALAAGQTAALIDNPFCPPDVKAQAQQAARALATLPPPAPPAQVGFGPLQRVMPGSVRVAPAHLHQTNNTMAMNLWNAFVGVHKATLAKLAAQGGYMRTPFVWLSQAIWVLIEIDGFNPTKKEDTPEFSPAQKEPSGAIFQGLVAWAGMDLARQLILLCERTNIDLYAALFQMYEQLDFKKKDELRKVLQQETIEQWAQ